MFGIFPRYYITYHDSMRWIFIFYFLCPHFKSRSNSRCPLCVLGGWGTQVWYGLWGSTPSGRLQVFSLHFLKCSSCSSSTNFHLNGFSSKIIQYTAEG
jgi:hypothetical protein